MIGELLADVEQQGRDEALGAVHPALQKLTLDVHELIHGTDDWPGLRGGFETRADIVSWERRLAVRSLGQVPTFIYQGIASQLLSERDRPLVEALLTDGPLPEATAREWRGRVRRKAVLPAFNRAFRMLRTSATEYDYTRDDDDRSDDRDPRRMRYLAMRPALDDLNKWQRKALKPVLDAEGFSHRTDDDAEQILDWQPVLLNATYGEPIQLPNGDTIPVAEFVDRMYEREPWRELLTEPDRHRVRIAWAARFLIPSFNAGAREQAPGANEVAQAEKQQTQTKSL